MHKIKSVGGYLEVDRDGFIVKRASPGLFQGKWKPVIQKVTEAYNNHFNENLLSVYIRGSVAKGEAIDHLSDVDSFAIVHSPEIKINTEWGERFSEETVKAYPFVKGVEILARTLQQAKDLNRGVHIMLKTQSVCVFGVDVSSQILPLKPGKESSQHFRFLQSELQKSIYFFEQRWGEGLNEYLMQCAWIMKRVLRTGFELVMEKEQRYTRDLYPCFESFSKYYPEIKDLMYRTLELSINPSSDSEIVLPILKEWFLWMPDEIERVFDFKKF